MIQPIRAQPRRNSTNESGPAWVVVEEEVTHVIIMLIPVVRLRQDPVLVILHTRGAALGAVGVLASAPGGNYEAAGRSSHWSGGVI